jgi:von Willebrand factor type A domain
MQSAKRVVRSLVCVLVAALALPVQAARPATRPASGSADLVALKEKLASARVDATKARADVIKRLENSPQYKAATAEVAARETALGKAKASKDGVDWAEKMLRATRNHVARLRGKALADPDEATSRALDALAAARASYAKARDDAGLFHPPQDAKRIVFVCDASRHMLYAFAHLRGELTWGISDLERDREFNVIFFGELPTTALTEEFLPPTPDNKIRAYRFIEDVSTGGKPDPAAALEAAFRGKPQAIYLVAGGDFTENSAVLDQVKKLNQGAKVKIHTIFLGSNRFLTPSAMHTLWCIADGSGGTFDCLSTSDLEEGALKEGAR